MNEMTYADFDIDGNQLSEWKAVETVDIDGILTDRYSLSAGYLEIDFRQPMPRIPEKGECLVVKNGERVLFEGIVEVAWSTGFKLVDPIRAMGLYHLR